MDLFRSLDVDELEGRIQTLARQVASGASTIASPDAGSVTYVSRGEAIRTLIALERSRCRRLGLPAPTPDRWRFTRIVSVNDYHQR